MEYLNKAYLLIGGNVGNSFSYLNQSILRLQIQCGNVLQKSSVYETAAWGNTQQPPFLNQALQLHTTLPAPELMYEILKIEESLGRVRKEKYGPRTIDIDILLFNDEVHSTSTLTIPHKELQNRRFVLEPLAEIAPSLVHPVQKKTMKQLLAECTDNLQVKIVTGND